MKIVKTHRLKSRLVTDADIPRVMADALLMQVFFKENPYCVAVAHPQVNDTDPLKFFVMKDGTVVINAEVRRTVPQMVESVEGCLSFPGKAPIIKQRAAMVKVAYQIIIEGQLSRIQKQWFGNDLGAIMQHEIDHTNGAYCYDNNIT